MEKRKFMENLNKEICEILKENDELETLEESVTHSKKHFANRFVFDGDRIVEVQFFSKAHLHTKFTVEQLTGDTKVNLYHSIDRAGDCKWDVGGEVAYALAEEFYKNYVAQQ